MRVGFLNNQIDSRGTGNALFDYAHYNEEILNNTSFIIVPEHCVKDRAMEMRLTSRFGSIHRLEDAAKLNLDALYHIKSGEDDGYRGIPNVPYLVHAVFNHQPHGDKYAMVSEWLGNRHDSAYVPHILSLPNHQDNLRQRLGIPPTDIVFGRHGGNDTFDIPWVWDTIKSILRARDDVWFIFMNTNMPEMEHFEYDNRLIFVDPTVDPYFKRTFINTCDAMLHARERGETFGIAVGEFAICDKTVFTYYNSPEQAHIEELLNSGIPWLYTTNTGLYFSMLDFIKITPQQKYVGGYKRYTPEFVMNKFKEVFLS